MDAANVGLLSKSFSPASESLAGVAAVNDGYSVVVLMVALSRR